MNKVRTLAELVEMRVKWRAKRKKVVFTNGCFDLLHGGHIWLFHQAKKLGDILVVAVNSDDSIRKLKGKSRPIFPLSERLEILEAIEDIDYLMAFDDLTPHKVISRLLPDILVKGGDWSLDQIVGREEVEKAGGKVAVIPYRQGKSTSEIIQKILRLENDKKENDDNER